MTYCSLMTTRVSPQLMNAVFFSCLWFKAISVCDTNGTSLIVHGHGALVTLRFRSKFKSFAANSKANPLQIKRTCLLVECNVGSSQGQPRPSPICHVSLMFPLPHHKMAVNDLDCSLMTDSLLLRFAWVYLHSLCELDICSNTLQYLLMSKCEYECVNVYGCKLCGIVC